MNIFSVHTGSRGLHMNKGNAKFCGQRKRAKGVVIKHFR